MVGPTVALISLISTPKLFRTFTICSLFALISSISTNGLPSLSYFFSKSIVGYLYFVNGSFGFIGVLKISSFATAFFLSDCSGDFDISTMSSLVGSFGCSFSLFLAVLFLSLLYDISSVRSITVGVWMDSDFSSVVSITVVFLKSSFSSLSTLSFACVSAES